MRCFCCWKNVLFTGVGSSISRTVVGVKKKGVAEWMYELGGFSCNVLNAAPLISVRMARKEVSKITSVLIVIANWLTSLTLRKSTLMSSFRYDLARLHRKTLGYLKSVIMLGHSVQLLLHYLKFWDVPVPPWFILQSSNTSFFLRNLLRASDNPKYLGYGTGNMLQSGKLSG